MSGKILGVIVVLITAYLLFIAAVFFGFKFENLSNKPQYQKPLQSSKVASISAKVDLTPLPEISADKISLLQLEKCVREYSIGLEDSEFAYFETNYVLSGKISEITSTSVTFQNGKPVDLKNIGKIYLTNFEEENFDRKKTTILLPYNITDIYPILKPGFYIGLQKIQEQVKILNFRCKQA